MRIVCYFTDGRYTREVEKEVWNRSREQIGVITRHVDSVYYINQFHFTVAELECMVFSFTATGYPIRIYVTILDTTVWKKRGIWLYGDHLVKLTKIMSMDWLRKLKTFLI